MTLYRTHRPQTWKDLIGQKHVKATLTNEIKTNQVAHAFLFCGPRGVGKTTTARLIAKSLNCINRKDEEFEPCNTCNHCDEITRGKQVDVIEIDAASHTGVDNVRENIIENARFTPLRAKFKVFIIDEVHMLSTSAFNALLKTIEEPPEHVKFILATTESHKVPATIVSRCQKFDFRHVSWDEILERLQILSKKEEVSVNQEVLEHITFRANGSVRDAESLLGQLLSLDEKTITPQQAESVLPSRKTHSLITYISSALCSDAGDAIEVLHDVVDQGVNIPHFMDDLIDTLRALLLIKTTGSVGDTWFNKGDKEELTKISSKHDIQKLMDFLEILLQRRNQIGITPIVHLPLELAAIQVAKISEPASQPKKNKTEKETKKITPVSTQKINNGPIPDINEIKKQWPQFLEHVHTYNHSLPFILKTCKPKGINGNTLVVTLPYSFHKKRMEDAKVKSLISQALHDIYKCTLQMEATVDESIANESDKTVLKVLETFGGKVVE